MRPFDRFLRLLLAVFIVSMGTVFAVLFGGGGPSLWRGLEPAPAVASVGDDARAYDLTKLAAVNDTLHKIQDKYVDPSRVHPRLMFLGALNQIQREVAPVIVTHEEKAPTVKLRVFDQEQEFRVDNIEGVWDVAARLRQVFTFLQQNLAGKEIELSDVEYAACNGILRTLDPHSVFLTPDDYEEMQTSTQGQFGGLGIVISIRDQQLTVMRPMPGTPAGRAGLQRFDRITKIDSVSTLNMPLEDAVKRLRGEPDSKVTVWIHRDGPGGWSGSKPFELTREVIRVESVVARRLEGDVLYTYVKHFQATTSSELRKALTQAESEGKLKGLVLDLRGNPGGLLEQAAEVVDLFVDDGDIVSTVGGKEGREVKRARRAGTQPNYPLVVLVDPSSASASEIVAGALKEHDRAVIVGETTFGKGSVQLVFPNVAHSNAALKLTIAQYLLPNDVSIQGVGIAPDIALDPMTADELEMDLLKSEDTLRERDLAKSLGGAARRSATRSTYRLRYDLPEKERARMKELGEYWLDEFQADFPVRLAQKLAAAMPVGRRTEQLAAVKDLVAQVETEEMDKTAKALRKLGADWAAPPAGAAAGPKASDFDVVVSTDRPGDEVKAGEKMTLSVRVTNKGAAPIFRLHALTRSDNDFFDEKELVFGRIDPGETRTVTAPLGWCDIEGRKLGSTTPLPTDAKRGCKIPLSALDREDVVRVTFAAEGGEAPREAEFRPKVRALPQPLFAYSYQVVDNRPGNGDGQLERGEGATMYLTVKNVGTGPSYETQANLRSLSGEGVLLHAGRFDVSGMKPGEERQVMFSFDVLPQLESPVAKLEISIEDRDLRVASGEKLSLPIVRRALEVAAATGLVEPAAADGAALLDSPVADATRFGTLPQGAKVRLLGTRERWSRVELGTDRSAWVESSALRPATGAPRVEVVPAFTQSPPLLTVQAGALSTRESHVRVSVVATDPDGVLDAYVYVGGSKVFYQASGKAGGERLEFAFDAELEPGVNVITVIARENDDTVSRYTAIVRRDGPNGEALPTPKLDVFGADWVFGDEGAGGEP